MKKTLIALLIVVAAVMVLNLINRDKDDNSIKVGAILPLTGDFAFAGEEMRRGLMLAVAEHSDAGIKLIIEDDETFDERAALDALFKLINVDDADIVLNVAVSTVKALAPALASSEVPGVVIWDSTNEVPGLSDYAYSMGFSVESAGTDMATFMHIEHGVRRVAVISALEHWSDIISTSFKKQFKQEGGEIVLHEKMQLGSSDYKTVIAKSIEAGAEALYIPLFPEDIDPLVRQTRQLGFEGPIYSGDGFSDINVANLGDYAEGIHFTQMWLEDQSFRDRYKEMFGEESNPINLAFAAVGYDGYSAVVKMKQELEAAGREVTSSTLKEALETLELNGVGGYTKLNRDHVADKHESILKVKNGDLVLVKTF